MEKERNALIIMFIFVIAICGGFILLKKTDINLNFKKNKEQTNEPQEVAKDYSIYKGKYTNLEDDSIVLEIINISEKNIDFSINVLDEGKEVTLIEKKLTEAISEQYNFTYKDSYNNDGKGIITLGEGHILLTLDTDIKDENLSRLGLGNFRNQKLYKEGTNVKDYKDLIGEYVLKDNENSNMIINVGTINESTIRLFLAVKDPETNITTNYQTQLVSVADYKYNFTYRNETQTCKGTGIIEIKNSKLYLTLTSDEGSIEKALPDLVDAELLMTE